MLDNGNPELRDILSNVHKIILPGSNALVVDLLQDLTDGNAYMENIFMFKKYHIIKARKILTKLKNKKPLLDIIEEVSAFDYVTKVQFILQLLEAYEDPLITTWSLKILRDQLYHDLRELTSGAVKHYWKTIYCEPMQSRSPTHRKTLQALMCFLNKAYKHYKHANTLDEIVAVCAKSICHEKMIPLECNMSTAQMQTWRDLTIRLMVETYSIVFSDDQNEPDYSSDEQMEMKATDLSGRKIDDPLDAYDIVSVIEEQRQRQFVYCTAASYRAAQQAMKHRLEIATETPSQRRLRRIEDQKRRNDKEFASFQRIKAGKRQFSSEFTNEELSLFLLYNKVNSYRNSNNFH